MRYVVLGAGGIGCAVGGLLHHAGAKVVFIARGGQLEALRARGLVLAFPDRSLTLDVEAAERVAAASGDVVLLCTKSQDTAEALELVAADAPVVCMQNGLHNERVVAERHAAYGAMVFVPASYLEPGRVTVHSAPCPGVIDVGCFPSGSDAIAGALVADLVRAGYDAAVDEDIMRAKRTKLISNLGNVLQALGGNAALENKELRKRVQAEGRAAFDAAGLSHRPLRELYQRAGQVNDQPVAGASRLGGSSWQSLKRGQTLESEHLNGEIVRLGAAHGVPTPLNGALLELARQASRQRWPAAKLSVDEIDAYLISWEKSRLDSRTE